MVFAGNANPDRQGKRLLTHPPDRDEGPLLRQQRCILLTVSWIVERRRLGLNRREFMTGAAAALLVRSGGHAQGGTREAKLARIGVMSGAFSRETGTAWDPPGQTYSLDIMDVPA